LDNQPLPDIFAMHSSLHPKGQVSLRDCTPKLTDFGLARLLDIEGTPAEEGMTAGTPAYMSPEQARGERDCTVEVDIWSLGATLYEMLTARPPFKGSTARETLRLILMEEPIPPRKLNPAVPPELEAICLKCLRKDPEQRYPTARELAQELQAFLTLLAETKPKSRWSLVLVGAVAGIAALAVLGTAWVILSGGLW